MVEGARLESAYVVQTASRVRIPLPPPEIDGASTLCRWRPFTSPRAENNSLHVPHEFPLEPFIGSTTSDTPTEKTAATKAAAIPSGISTMGCWATRVKVRSEPILPAWWSRQSASNLAWSDSVDGLTPPHSVTNSPDGRSVHGICSVMSLGNWNSAIEALKNMSPRALYPVV